MEQPDPRTICFGLSEEMDKSSIITYLQLFGRSELASVLAERLSSEEIEALVDHLGGLLRRHLNKQEYHQLFLLEPEGHEHG